MYKTSKYNNLKIDLGSIQNSSNQYIVINNNNNNKYIIIISQYFNKKLKNQFTFFK